MPAMCPGTDLAGGGGGEGTGSLCKGTDEAEWETDGGVWGEPKMEGKKGI